MSRTVMIWIGVCVVAVALLGMLVYRNFAPQHGPVNKAYTQHQMGMPTIQDMKRANETQAKRDASTPTAPADTDAAGGSNNGQ